MKLKLKAYYPIGDKYSSQIGVAILYNSDIVSFELTDSAKQHEFLKPYSSFKRTSFTAKYFDKYDSISKLFNTEISAENIRFGVKIGRIQKFKLNWMLKKYWVQQQENQWKIIALILPIIAGVVIKILNIV